MNKSQVVIHDWSKKKMALFIGMPEIKRKWYPVDMIRSILSKKKFAK